MPRTLLCTPTYTRTPGPSEQPGHLLGVPYLQRQECSTKLVFVAPHPQRIRGTGPRPLTGSHPNCVRRCQAERLQNVARCGTVRVCSRQSGEFECTGCWAYVIIFPCARWHAAVLLSCYCTNCPYVYGQGRLSPFLSPWCVLQWTRWSERRVGTHPSGNLLRVKDTGPILSGEVLPHS